MTVIASPDVPDRAPALHRPQAASPFAIPWPFLVLCAEIFIASTLLSVYLAFRDVHPDAQRPAVRFPHWGWGAAQLAFIGLATFFSAALARRGRGVSRATVMTVSAVTIMLGLLALGLKAMEWARWGGPRIVIVDGGNGGGDAPRPAQASLAPKAVAADPAQGAKAFAGGCSACHGASGEGVAGMAPALKGSAFIAKATDAQVAAVISNGRMPGDPASVSGKMMPPRGGNPFLTDADVTAIVAFLRTLESGKAPTAPAGASAGAQVPRWVVPPAPRGPEGLRPRQAAAEPAAWIPPELQAQAPNRAERAFAPMAASFGAFQGLYLLVAIAIAAKLLWQAYAGPRDAAGDRLARFACVHWAMGLAMWVAIFPLLYVA